MFAAVGRGYQIFLESLSVLSKDKEILVFPLLSGVLCVLAFAALVLGGTVTGLVSWSTSSARAESPPADIVAYSVLFAWYFVTWAIVIFFNVAVIQCAKIRLDGGDPLVADGFRTATSHLPRILLWALIAATVGVVLRLIAERVKMVGALLEGILGAAWSVATFFIVPVMIFESRSLFDSFGQSARLVRKAWGESFTSLGIGFFVFLLALPSPALPIGLGILLGWRGALTGLVLMILYWLGLAVISSAVSAIFRTGLYIYATQGRIPVGISDSLVRRTSAPR